MAAFLQFDKHLSINHHHRVRMNCIPGTLQIGKPSSRDRCGGVCIIKLASWFHGVQIIAP